MSVTEIYDAVIVGGGPAGLNAALVLGRSRRSVLVVDSGQGRNEHAEGVHGLLASDGLPPAELRAVARKQLDRYEVRFAAATVRAIAGERGDFTLDLDDGSRQRGTRVVLATGVAEELPDLDGLGDRWGQGVLGCPYCHGWELRDRPLAVLAMSPDDVEFAAQLTQWSDDVVFCTNGSLQVTPDQRDALLAYGIAVCTTPIQRLDGPGRALERIVLADGRELPCHGLFVHLPTRQRSDLAERLGCPLLSDGSVEVDDCGRTGVPGVYAVGDMARRSDDDEGPMYVATAAASGFVAATALNQDLFSESLRRKLSARASATRVTSAG